MDLELLRLKKRIKEAADAGAYHEVAALSAKAFVLSQGTPKAAEEAKAVEEKQSEHNWGFQHVGGTVGIPELKDLNHDGEAKLAGPPSAQLATPAWGEGKGGFKHAMFKRSTAAELKELKPKDRLEERQKRCAPMYVGITPAASESAPAPQ